MNSSLPFRRNRKALLAALVSAAFAGQVSAAAGRVDFATGGATVSGADGRQRPLARGTDLDKGDTVRTDAGGRAQIRFTDGAYVSLQPNTEFAIKDYNFEGKTDGSERGLFALARGAMRTVTGLIGRVNRNRYQVSTPTATIGIRGTGGLITVLNDGSTLVNGSSGIWTLTNPSGTIDVPAGVSGKAPAAPNQPPQQSTEKPSTGPTQPPTTQPPYTQADNRDATGTSTTVSSGAKVLVTGPGYHVSYAYGGQAVTGAPLSGVNSSGTLANATFDSLGNMTAFSATNSASFSGTTLDFGTAGAAIAWGRWIGPMTVVDGGPVTFGSTLNANQGYHYVVGIPATAMPMTGSATFAFLGATSPTGSTGTFAPGSFSGTMTVNNWATGSISLTATLAFAGFSYNMTGSASFSPGNPQWTAGSFGSPGFVGTAPTGYQCSGGCTTTVNGAFFGTGAAFAGYAYKMTDGSSGNTITGAAAFKQ